MTLRRTLHVAETRSAGLAAVQSPAPAAMTERGAVAAWLAVLIRMLRLPETQRRL